MKLRHEPLLQLQRDLYRLPRGFERFREYLRVMTNAAGDDLQYPLVGMNPTGNDHLPAMLDELLALDADGVAARAVADAQAALAEEPGEYAVILVVSDDRHGAWTGRYAAELTYRFDQKHFYSRGWIVPVLWTSETYTAERVRAAVWAAILRAVYVQRHGYAHTLRERLAQEGCVLRQVGTSAPVLDAGDLAHTRAVLAPYLDRSDELVVIPALFGDRAAEALGYPKLGLSEGAGLALALADGL